jgi:hypothetical protein
MKLRIRGNSIRLRLTKTEVSNLADKGLVEETTDFGNGKTFVYSVKVSNEVETIDADFTYNHLQIFIPIHVAENWANNDTEVSVSSEQKPLKILIEKDFTCLNPRTGEEDADTFPHPKEKELIC